MKVIFLTGFIFLSAILLGQEKKRPIPVSFIRLMSNPEKYDGKYISIDGFLHVKFENNALYFSKEQANYLIFEAFEVSFDSSFLKKNDMRKFDRKYVHIVGWFHKAREDPFNLYQGWIDEIDNVTFLRKWYK